MNVVDSSGWIEYALDGSNAEEFQEPLSNLDQLIVPAISVFDVYRLALRERGRQVALTLAATMRQGKVIDLDAGLAVEARGGVNLTAAFAAYRRRPGAMRHERMRTH